MADAVSPVRDVTPTAGGVMAPAGFQSAALHSGIKAAADVLDLVVIAADTIASAAALFTTNLVQAAPVIVSRNHLAASEGRARAIIVNSGCANACTGHRGITDAERMTAETAAALGATPDQVLVASTGVIGVNLKMEKVVPAIGTAVAALTPGRGHDVARAIMTTDLFPKDEFYLNQTKIEF